MVSYIFGEIENINVIILDAIGGHVDDGYLCSSTWMRNSYKRRPQDFKRRIIKKFFTTKKEMFFEEYRYLQMIKLDELGKRYYNLRRAEYNLNASSFRTGKSHSEETKQKIREKRKLQVITEEHKQNISASLKEISKPQFSEEHKRNISKANKGRIFSEETKKKMCLSRQNISENTRERLSQNNAKYWQGKSLSEEHKEKIKKKLKGKPLSEKTKEKMKQSQQQRRIREKYEI